MKKVLKSGGKNTIVSIGIVQRLLMKMVAQKEWNSPYQKGGKE